LLGSETGRRAATSGVATTHAIMHVTRADVVVNNADCIVYESSDAAQARNPTDRSDDVVHFFTNLYLPLLADQDLAPF
jgi:hypothetical protein